MIKVNSKVTLNMDYLRQLTEAQAVALEQTAEALHDEVQQAQVVPRDTGALQGENMFVDVSGSKQGTVSIVHSTPYARRLYYHPEYHFSTTENPNAKGHWFEDWEEGGKHDEVAVNCFQDIYRRLTGL